MPPKQRSAEYFDGWYADRVATPTVDEIMNRHMGFPPDTRAGVVPAEAIPELASRVRLRFRRSLVASSPALGLAGLIRVPSRCRDRRARGDHGTASIC